MRIFQIAMKFSDLIWGKPLKLIISLAVLVIFRAIVSSVSPNWDSAFLIDGAYRVNLGFIPNRDFYSPIGPLVFYLGAVGFELTTNSLFGFDMAITIFGLLIALFHYYINNMISQNKLGNIISGIFIFALLATPRALSYGSADWSLAGIYNKICYGLILSLILSNFLAYRCGKHDGILKGWSAVLITLLFFTKITFFFVAIFLYALWQISLSNYRLLISTIFLCVLLICSTSFLNFDLRAYIADIIYTAEVASPTYKVFEFASIKIFLGSVIPEIFFYFSLIFLSAHVFPRKLAMRIICTGFLFLVADYLISLTIAQPYELVMLVIYSCVILLNIFLLPNQSNKFFQVRGCSNFIILLISLSLYISIGHFYKNTEFVFKRGLKKQAISGLFAKMSSLPSTHTYSKIPNALMSALEENPNWGGNTYSRN